MGTGQYIIPIKREFLNLSGGTVTGSTLFTQNLSASTYYSGATELSQIIIALSQSAVTPTFLQNGINTFTGGTLYNPNINVTGISLDNIFVSGDSVFISFSATNFSASTIYSASTDIADIFATQVFAALLQDQINTKANRSGDTFTGTVFAPSLSATTLSGGTIYSGDTELGIIIQSFVNSASTTNTFVQNGLNTYTGGTQFFPTVNVSALTISGIIVSGDSLFNSLSATTLSGGTVYSGETDLNVFFNQDRAQINEKADLTGATFTGSIFTPSISANTIVSGSTDLSNLFATQTVTTGLQNQINTKANRSGDTFTGIVFAPSLSATTLSGGTIYSGTTELSSVIQNMIVVNETFVQNGTNTYTGGTNFRPTVNVSALTVNTIIASGNTSLQSLSATTIISGSTDLNAFFNQDRTQINTKVNRSGDTFTGVVFAPALSATTLSGGTIFSGSTELGSVIQNMIVINETFVQNGTNTYTGGTAFRPTVNVSALTVSTIVVSGNSNFNTLSATTLSGGTILSGSTDLSNLFANQTLTTGLQNQINTKANRSGDTFTGTVFATALSATTLSGGTIFSGNTELSQVIQSMINNDETFVQSGTNTYTGGTAFRPTVNVSALTINTITASGSSKFSTLSATTLSAGTIYSGTTNIENIFLVKSVSAGTNNRVVLFDGTTNGLKESFVTINPSGDILPLSANTQSLGNSGLSFSNLFLNNNLNFNTAINFNVGAISALTINSGGTMSGIGFTILSTGEIQTLSTGHGVALPGTRGIGAVDLQTKRALTTQIASGNYAVILGGINNSSKSLVSVVAGGYSNTAYNFGASVVGGADNNALGTQSFIGAGRYNKASSTNSTIAGGYTNSVYGNAGSVLGGRFNVSSGFSQTVIGTFNKIQGTPYSFINTDNAFIIGNGTSLTNRSNAFSVTWQGAVQTTPISGATLPTTNISDGALAFSAGTGLFQYVGGVWNQLATSSVATGTTASNIGGTQGIFSQKVGNNLQFKSLSAGTNIQLFSSSTEVSINLNSGITVSSISASTISANTFSAGTIISGSTNLYNIFQTAGNPSTQIQNGLNTYTGGTTALPTVNVSALTINTINASGSSNFNTLSATILSGGTILSGSTNLYNIFAQLGNEVTAVQPGSNIVTGGTITQPIISVVPSPLFNNLTASGNTSLQTLSATTYISGSTNLYNIFQSIGNPSTQVQNGLNTYTGGTTSLPTVNVSALTINTITASGNSNFNTLSATTLSGGTILSGATNLYNIFAQLGNEVTAVQPGSNITTGGTITQPIVSVVPSPSFNNLNASGNTSLQTLSATTYISGSTNLYNIFQTAGNPSTQVQNGLNTYTGGTVGFPTVNVSALTINTINASGSSNFNTLSATTLSGGTILSGATNLYNIFAQLGNEVTAVQPGSNIVTGGTSTVPIISLANSPSINALTTSGTTLINSNLIVTGTTLLSTLSATTFISGSTNLYNIFQTAGNPSTQVQNGLNTYTGGTVGFPTVNVSALTINTITASGNSNFNTLSATTLSGGTIFSGNTDLNVFFNQDRAQINGKADLTGATFIGNVTLTSASANTFSANTLSGGTILSGSTNLYNIFAQLGNEVTAVQPGSNIVTGGTITQPIVSVVPNPSFNNLTASGSSNFNTLSATTLSGGTILSGSTDLSNLFATLTQTNSLQNQINTKVNRSGDTFTGIVFAPSLSATTLSGGTIFSGNTELSQVIQSMINNDETFVQNGTNTYTGGTAFRPTVNVSALTISTISASGSSNFTTLSATTLSGGTILSGATNLYNIFAQLGNEVTAVQPGSNITTGGTITQPIISVVPSPSFNNLTASGTTLINSNLIVTGTTLLSALSATTIISGSTNLYNIFQTTPTFVGNGLNTYTGGTLFNPTVNVSALTVNTITASGTSNFNGISATTLSGGTIYSGGTDIHNIFVNNGSNLGNGVPVFNQNSGGTLQFSTLTGGTNVTVTSGNTIVVDISSINIFSKIFIHMGA